MSQDKKHNSNKLSGIWLTVLLLTILVLASAALLGSFIKRYAAQEKNVIAVMIDSNKIKNEYNDNELPAGATPDLKPSWEANTSVDLFKTAYTDAEGNVTVKSHDGKNIIAPGTSNSYEFNLKNTGNISLDYTLNLEGVFKISDHYLPFYVRLSQGDKWLVGGENEWVHADMMKTLVEKATLPVNETATYIFEWQWPYESDDESQKLINDLNDTLISADLNDTNIGSVAVDVNTEFRLNISTTAVITPDAVAVMGDGVGVVYELVFVSAMSGLVLISGIWLILILLRRKIYFTGIIEPEFMGEIKLGNKTSEVTNSRFVFPKARFGKRTLSFDEQSETIQFKSRKVLEGIRFEYKGEKTIVVIDRKVRAVELYFADDVSVRLDKWAAIDKKHNVYTLGKVVSPVDKCNTTPGGLSIDKNNKLFITASAEGLNNDAAQKEIEKV